MDEDKSRLQRDIKELFGCKLGIESDKITERKKSAARLRELLELGHVVDYLASCSGGEGSRKGRQRSSVGVAGNGITWGGLWSSVVEYVGKEGDAISKLEEKGSGSTSAYTSRQNKKKDVTEMVRAFCKYANKKGHHIPVSEVIDHMISVLGHSRLGVWLGTDYSHILWQHIISVPHYVLHMSPHKWEDLTSLYCQLFLSPSPSLDRALLSKIIHTLIVQWQCQADLPIPTLYNFFTKAFAKAGEQPKVWEHLLAALLSFSTAAAINARGRLCSLGEDIFLNCLHQWGRCPPAVKDHIVEFFRIQLTVHHPRGTHTDEEGAWATNDAVWQSHLEKLHDVLMSDLEARTNRLKWEGKSDNYIKFEILDLMADVFHQVFWMHSHVTSDPSVHRAKRRKSTSGWAVLRDGLLSTMDSPSAVIWLQVVARLVSKWPQSLRPPDHASLLSALAQMLRKNKRVVCIRWALVCLHVLALHPSALTVSTSLPISTTGSLSCSSASTLDTAAASSLPSLHSNHSANGIGEKIWQKIWNSTIKMLSVRTAEEEGYNLLTVLLERGLVSVDLDPWKLLTTALQQPASCMLSFLASLLSSSQTLPESLQFGLSLPMAASVAGPTQTQSSSSLSSSPSSLYPLRTQLLHLLTPTNASLTDSHETSLRLSPLSKIPTSTPVSLLASILVGLTQRSCGCTQLPSLKQLYLHSNSEKYIHQMLDLTSRPALSSLALPLQLLPPPSPSSVRGVPSREDVWRRVEHVYLNSTFDLSLDTTSLQPSSGKTESNLSRENTITELQALLLDLLSERAQMLLKQPSFEPSASSRERCHYLSSLLEGTAHHCSLIVHTVLLLCHCEAFTKVEQLRRTPAVRILPDLLKRFVCALKDPFWNEMEATTYHQAAAAGLRLMIQLIHFPHLERRGSTLSSSVTKALRVVKKLCSLSMTKELIEVVSSLAQGKWPAVSPLASASTFSLCGSSSNGSGSRGPSLTRDSQNSSSSVANFDDDMELGDSLHSTQNHETTSTHLNTPADVLNAGGLNEKSLCQIEAARFLAHCALCLSSASGSHGDGDVMAEDGGDMASDVCETLIGLLEDHSKPVHIHIVRALGVLHICADSANTLQPEMLASLMNSLALLLKSYRNNQTVYCCCLEVQTQLISHVAMAPPIAPPTEDYHLAKQHSRSLLSAFWTLYKDGRLCSSVRIQLARLVQAMLEADRGGEWAWIDAVRKRRGSKDGGEGERKTNLKDAMVSLANDVDHGVRMHMASAVTSLFFCDDSTKSHDSHVMLLPREEQEKIYQQVLAMLQDAYQVMASQDQLSAEDDSVNRVASLMATLLYEASVSPVCERNVASLLISAVGQIDHDLVAKALGLLATYLGYSGRRQFLEDVLVSLVKKWLEEEQPLLEFPIKLFDFETPKEFFSTYRHQIVPLLVSRCDEATLESLSSDILGTSLHEILKESLPACMVLILTSYTEQGSGGEGAEEGGGASEKEKQLASNSHNLLTKILSEETISQTIQNSVHEFVVELLVRMFEPPTADSHLTRFCLTSDPEPCPPHYTSHAVRATLDYLPSCYGNTAVGTSFIRLLSKKKDNIQKILLSLAMKIDSTHRWFIKRRLLLAYNLFIKLICRELRDGLDKTLPFVVMDIIHTISRIISSVLPKQATPTGHVIQLFPVCCDTLETLCRAVLTACPQELAKHLLQTVVAGLIPFAKENSTDGKQALSLLTYLLQTADRDSVSKLDPFPRAVPLPPDLRQEIGGATTLSNEIERFLSAGVSLSRAEGLRSLGQLLHKSRLELASLIEKGCHGDSTILRLVGGLVALCVRPECGRETRLEVARCLGQLGPADFRCIALSPTNNSHSTFDVSSLPSSWSPSQVYTAKLLYLLTNMLMDKSVGVVAASSECLRAVLATKTATFVLSKLEEQSSSESASEWCLYLEPFKPNKKKKTGVSIAPPTTATPTSIESCDLWIPSKGVSHGQWLTRLVTAIIDSGAVEDELLSLTRNVCSVKVEFCEEVFPLLVYNLLSSQTADWRDLISRQLRLFFETVNSAPRPSTPSFSHQSLPTSTITSDSVLTILNTIMYLRTVNRPRQKSTRGSGTPWDNNFWLDLDFLAVAKAAHVCSAHFTSLLFTEIWSGAKGQSSSDVMEVTGEPSQQIESVDVQRMLLVAYRQIGEPDSLYGACSTHVTDETTRVHLYQHEKEWEKALSACDLQMLLPGATSESNIAESLRQLGLYHVLNMYLCGSEGVRREGLIEYQYEAAWRCGQWDEGGGASLVTPAATSVSGDYHQTLYSCLTALRDGETELVNSSIAEARCRVIQSLSCTGLESTYGLYPSLGRLLSLLEVEEAGSSLQQHLQQLAGNVTTLHDDHSNSLDFIKDWKERLPLLNSDFQFVEPVLATRCSLLHCLLQSAAAEVKGHSSAPPTGLRRRVEHLFDALTENLLTRAEFAREAGSFQVCEGALFALKQHVSLLGSYGVPESLCPALPWTLKIEEAKLSWERKDTTLAMALLKTLLNRYNMLSDPAPSVKALYPSALCLYGSWLAETRSENPSVIMDTYLERSVHLMGELRERSEQELKGASAYLTLARYADGQYQRINRHMRSSTFEAKRQLLQKSKQELRRLEEQLSPEARNRSRHYRTLMAQSKEDEIAIQSMERDKETFLSKALKNYILCLRTGDKYDLRVFRLCALWFANSNNSTVNKLIKEGSSLLESRKFLPLMYQLAARMSARHAFSDFQKTLQEIIYRTTVDHPYHCLYIILALSNASKDNLYPVAGHVTGTLRNQGGRGGGRLQRKQSTVGSVDEDKVKAAGDMIKKLRSVRPSLVQSVERLCDAYIDLAYHDVTAYKKERGPVKLPSTCLLLKLGELTTVPVPTVEIPVDPTCCYDNIVSIDRFDHCFQLAGGVNLPKVMSCIGSDGKRRRQLVKGRDDLRQDAVMQQVFVLVNRLLMKEPSTLKRRLCVRTYNVIPLSQRSGIVEWCEGTLPLGDYLIGSPQNPHVGAHARYRPADWTSIECRKKLLQAGTSKARVYSDICSHFKPVFHHFFMEKFTSPPQWFERRLTYTRSVAASSIVGYIVGLGDRHVQNILIDTNSAELIHIDLGVAFEQGKTLPTPETVPFRLTRDLVDGMGVAGVEGVFRQCCEKTMVLMRTYQEELRTILEVLLYDPLYQWSMSPLKAMHLQRRQEPGEESTSFFDGAGETSNNATASGGEGESTNKMAERVLIRLQEKLEGIEEGVPLSISGQVNHLIQEATDPANLCKLFPGWQPWI